MSENYIHQPSRPKLGLIHQHLACVQAAVAVCGGHAALDALPHDTVLRYQR